MVRFRLLGPMAVLRDDGSPLNIPAPKRRALLAALLLNTNRDVGPDELVRELWGDEPPPAAIPSLHAHVSRLRRELGSGVIETGANGYRACVRDGELDVAEFERLAAEGRRALREGRFMKASSLLTEGLALWRGPALVDIPGEFNRQSRAAALEEARLAAIGDRIEADLRSGRHAQLVPELRQLTANFPLHERLWEQLMLALYRSGRQADALAAYRDLRRLLVDELGVDPSPDLQELERRILRQEPKLADAGRAFQLSGRLPTWNTPLIGREKEADELASLAIEHRLLTLTGPGGVGKTRLGIEVARRVVGLFEDGVQLVDLSPVRDPALVLSTIGLEIGAGERPWELIHDRHALLALDNFEQVLGAAPGISELLDRCERLHVIVTSRAPLRLAGEVVFEVPPLAESAAEDLFQARAREAMQRWQADRRTLTGIVEHLDGLPLAIELTAARVMSLAPAALRDALERPLRVMSEGRRDSPARHRTLRSTIDWSYELLSEPARTSLRGLSVFAGGCDLDGAVSVAGASIDSVRELVDHSLLRRDGERYRLLETIREFAAEEAALHGEADALRDTHLSYCIELISASSRRAADAERREGWLATCSRERDNLRVAFDWALSRGDDAAVLTLAGQAGMYWLIAGAMAEGERWAQAAVDRVRHASEWERAARIMLLGEFPRWSGRHERAVEVRREGIELARQTDDADMLATLLDDAAWSMGALGRHEEANAMLREALGLRLTRPNDFKDLAHTYAAIGWQRLREGRAEEALHAAKLTREMEARDEPPPHGTTETDDLEARALLACGRSADAESLFLRALRDSTRIDFKIVMLDALAGLATIAAATAPEQAARLLGMADRVRAESGLEIFDQAGFDAVVDDLRMRLGAASLDQFRREGFSISLAAIPDAALAAELPA